jgi:hypothetical protein
MRLASPFGMTERLAPATGSEQMETLEGALRRFEAMGYGEALHVAAGGFLVGSSSERLAPESLCVVELARFEGESDPADEAVIYALSTDDGRVRGTFVAPYGASIDGDAAKVIQRLRSARRKRSPARL